MVAAIKAKDLKDALEGALPQETRDKRARKRTRARALRGKTFESLTPPQKDKLLKALAVKAGLIEDSEDA